jgi:hypothetical protein
MWRKEESRKRRRSWGRRESDDFKGEEGVEREETGCEH